MALLDPRLSLPCAPAIAAVLVVRGRRDQGVLGPAVPHTPRRRSAVGALMAVPRATALARPFPAAAALAVLLAVVLLPVLTTLDFARQIGSGGSLTARTTSATSPAPGAPAERGRAVADRRPAARSRPAVPRRDRGAAGSSGAVPPSAVAVRARDWTLPALVAIALAGSGAAIVVGAPWVDAKRSRSSPRSRCSRRLRCRAAVLGAEARQDRRSGPRRRRPAWRLRVVDGRRRARREGRARERLAELFDIGRLTAGRGRCCSWTSTSTATAGFCASRRRGRHGPTSAPRPRPTAKDLCAWRPSRSTTHRAGRLESVDRRAPLLARGQPAARGLSADLAGEYWRRGSARTMRRARGAPARRQRHGAREADGCAELLALFRTRRAAAGDDRARAPARRHRADHGSAEWQAFDDAAARRRRRRIDVTLPAGDAGAGGARLAARLARAVVDGRSLGVRRHELSHGHHGCARRHRPARGTHELVLRFRRGAPWRTGRGAGGRAATLGPIALTHADDEGDLRGDAGRRDVLLAGCARGRHWTGSRRSARRSRSRLRRTAGRTRSAAVTMSTTQSSRWPTATASRRARPELVWRRLRRDRVVTARSRSASASSCSRFAAPLVQRVAGKPGRTS